MPSSNRSMRAQLLGLLFFFALCFGAAAIGGWVTAESVGGWYQTINKPSFNPPDWIFAPVWSTLFAMMAISAWLVWRTQEKSRRALTVFGIQLVLNLLWSTLFFGLKAPGLAVIDILFLSAAIWLTIALFRPISRVAALLLVPYALWVAFATVLNAAIVILN